ncbi:uncharacterized protein LOC119547006 isoform X2 [Drosophila subpulchrella]|uniref:uncharacterized protein LOC119547006 isoform X2 n=1 Tax=Drosophila subpulchrella TaxID=1486046 RepID=UPI0018A16EFB|nr:uncharacterized protein LOC119547006 isoform X2 [Drosophila subpulchrella]
MATAKQLTKITDIADLKDLQKLYLKDWSSHCVAYFWLDNYLRWLHQNPSLEHLNFYTLDNDWKRDGLFILHRYQLFFSNISKQKTELKLALKLLDWSGGFKVSAIQEAHHEIYKELVAELNLNMDREMNTIMFSLNCQEAEQLGEIKCPEGYYLDKVRLEHADLINDLWSARHPGSLKLIQMLITYNTNVGLYEKESGSLCAWCLRLQSGFLGALEVIQSHQRRGLGLVVAAAISKAIATDLQQDITALVNMNNNAARRVFEKLNFKLLRGEHYYWSMIRPNGGGQISWPSNE